MSIRVCEHPNCKSPAGFVCDGCEGDFCEDCLVTAFYVNKDADDSGWIRDYNGDSHVCEDCLNG